MCGENETRIFEGDTLITGGTTIGIYYDGPIPGDEYTNNDNDTKNDIH